MFLEKERESGWIPAVKRESHRLHWLRPKKGYFGVNGFFLQWEFILGVFFPLNLSYMVDLSPQIILVLDWLWIFGYFFGLFATIDIFYKVFNVFLWVEIWLQMIFFIWNITTQFYSSQRLLKFRQGKQHIAYYLFFKN